MNDDTSCKQLIQLQPAALSLRGVLPGRRLLHMVCKVEVGFSGLNANVVCAFKAIRGKT
jgi:hypothetical protein